MSHVSLFVGLLVFQGVFENGRWRKAMPAPQLYLEQRTTSLRHFEQGLPPRPSWIQQESGGALILASRLLC